MDKENIIKACEITYNNALRKCITGVDLAIYMFVEGFKFCKTNKMPTDDFETMLSKYKNKYRQLIKEL